MCGIAGFVQPRGGDPEHLATTAQAMATALAHRGPDGHGVWSDGHRGVFLAHRRLAILDPSPAGAQPMVSASGRYAVTFNGEIYNFTTLRAELAGAGASFRGTGDTEVLLAAMEAWGVERAIDRLVGMFAFALYDREAATLHLVRDRAGEKPLYYGVQGGTLMFASELKALRRHPDFEGRIDRGALAAFLDINCVPAPRSIYEDVAKLPPAGHLAVPLDAPLAASSALGARTRRYWRAAGLADGAPSGDPEAAFAAVENALTAAVRDAMVSDVPLGAFLSGGLDSSTVVATMQAVSPWPVKTFTIGFEDDLHDEAQHARAVAKHLGTDHTELYVRGEDALAVVDRLPEIFDEPFADASQIPTYLIAELARRDVTVALTGDGGDELFGGYSRHLLASTLLHRIGWMPRALRRSAAGLLRALPPAAWDRALAAVGQRSGTLNGSRLHKLAGCLDFADAGDLYRTVRSDWPATASLVPGATPCGDLASGTLLGDPAADFMLRDFETYLPDDVLAKVDRAAMAHSLETRVPLLDHRLVAAAWRLAMPAKFAQGRGKLPLRRILARHLPEELIDRPKHGFGVPLDAWLRGPLKDWAEDLLSPDALAAGDLLDPAPIRAAWQAHLNGRRDNGQALWHVLMFQAWRREV